MSAPQASPTPAVGSAAAWHDAECGSYGADLPIWSELAARHCAGREPAVELGAGTGRVSLELARRGHRVVALDSDPALLEVLAARAAARGLSVEALEGDARELRLPAGAGLILAPMQLMLQMGGPEGRRRLLENVRRALAAQGTFAAALLDEARPLESGQPDPVPDVRELDGWVHSSLPLEVVADSEAIEIHRLRQLVSPTGGLTEERDVIRLDRLPAEQLVAEAAEVGLVPLGGGDGRIAPALESPEHVDSIVVGLAVSA